MVVWFKPCKSRSSLSIYTKGRSPEGTGLFLLGFLGPVTRGAAGWLRVVPPDGASVLSDFVQRQECQHQHIPVRRCSGVHRLHGSDSVEDLRVVDDCHVERAAEGEMSKLD